MSTYHAVLYIHLLALLLAMAAAGVLLLCLGRLRAARTGAEAAPFGMLAEKAARAFPIAVLVLFGSGAYMTSDLWTWGSGWIEVSVGGLALLALQGPLVAGRFGRLAEQALRANGAGELGEHARRMCRHPALWVSELSNLGLVLGIVWNMTQKPGLAGAIAAVVVGYGVGAAAGIAAARVPGVATAPVTEPAA